MWTWVSAKTAVPAANAVQVDTGPLAAGFYDFVVNLVCADAVGTGRGLVVEHRNATNAATINVLAGCASADSKRFRILGFLIAANERIRVIAGTANGGGGSMYVSAIAYQLSQGHVGGSYT